MTDYLLILLPPYALGAILLAVVWRKRSVAIFGVYIVGVVFILLELAKAVYWTLIWAGWFGLSCAKYQFCLSHNPGEPVGTAIFQFKFAVIFAYVSALLSFGVILTQSIVRSGRLHTLVVNGKAPRHRPPTTKSAQQNNTKQAYLNRFQIKINTNPQFHKPYCYYYFFKY
jgi:hypothetical protein